MFNFIICADIFSEGVAQERYLATRVLHFTTDTVFWQCLGCWTVEAFPDGLPPFSLPTYYHSPSSVQWEAHLKTLVQDYRRHQFESVNQEKGDEEVMVLLAEICDHWRNFIHSYTGYGLTKESDIFVALQGIAQDIVTDALNDRLVAGLLEQRLMHELCWTICYKERARDEPHRPAKWRAPSWSWASTKLPVELPRLHVRWEPYRYDMAKTIKWHAPTKPSGELIEAALWVECRLFRMDVRFKGWHGTMFIRGTENTFEETRIHMDDPTPDDQAGHIRKVYLMPTSRHNYSTGARSYIEGPALELSDEDEGAYKRIGCFNISIEWNGSPDHEASKEPFWHVMQMLKETEPQVVKIV